MAFASPKRLSTRMIPIAPAELRASAFETKRADAARHERDLAGQRALRAACRGSCSGRSPDPQRCGSTGLPSVPTIVDDVDDRLVEGRPRARQLRRRRRPGSGPRRATAGRRRRESAGANTCEFDVAATEIASGAVPGRAGRAEAEVLAVVAGGDHRHDAGERRVVDRLVHRVVRRVGLRAAAREVDDVHAVGDCRLECVDDLRRVGLVAERRRNGEDAVVADPRLRRDAREARRPRVVACRPARSCPRHRRRCRRRACRAARSRRTPWCSSRRAPGRGTPSRRSPWAS